MSETYEQSLISQNIRNVLIHQKRSQPSAGSSITASVIEKSIAPYYNYRGPICDFSGENINSITSKCDKIGFSNRMMLEGIKLRTTSTSTSVRNKSFPSSSSSKDNNLASIRYISPYQDTYPQYTDTIKLSGKSSDSEEAMIEQLINQRKYYRYTDYLHHQYSNATK